MMNKKLIEAIRKEFERLLSGKNGWGKNEAIRAFDKAVSNVALDLLDKKGSE